MYGLLSALHQDSRTLAIGPKEVRQFQSETSVMPFGAILAGKQQLAIKEYSAIALVVAILCFTILRLLHGTLFGGFG